MPRNEVTSVLGKNIRRQLSDEKMDFRTLQEIRLRIGKPMIVISNGRERVFPGSVSREDFQETLEYVSNYSLYAFENELKQGFLTIAGGHRVGVAGQVLLEQGRVKNMKQISSLNIRVSHEIPDCAKLILPYVTKEGQIYNTLLISPPRCGKTTLLRDLIRQVSDGGPYLCGSTVGVVDERSELAACYMGVPQNQLGLRTDVLDCCPKAEGMLMLIRSMGPQVIAVDEIGSREDIQALEYAMHCGCKMLATVHGSSMEEICRKPLFDRLVSEEIFERYVVLENRKQVGEIKGIYDAKGELLCRG
ncbi:MAG: stage III sporulation protein AA [Faecalimonas sp.]|nr:stage III sporulation protein AA [Faecalimonas sp.]